MNCDWFPLTIVTSLPFVSDWSKDGHVTQIWPMRQKEKSIPILLWQKELVHVLLSFTFGIIVKAWWLVLQQSSCDHEENYHCHTEENKEERWGKFRSLLTVCHCPILGTAYLLVKWNHVSLLFKAFLSSILFSAADSIPILHDPLPW